MSNLAAELALETAKSFRYGTYVDMERRIARALIQMRIEAMQDCAREHCQPCFYDRVPTPSSAGFTHELVGCDAQYEQREIAKGNAELAKLDPASGG